MTGLLARLTGTGRPADSSLTVHVLNRATPCAYAWPDGHLFVAAGLMRLLDDDELTATLAHEMGHLQNDRLPAPAALGGAAGAECGDAREVEADAAGCRLLRARGLDPKSLTRALRKVRAAPQTSAETREALGRRIRLLERRDIDAPAALHAPEPTHAL